MKFISIFLGTLLNLYGDVKQVKFNMEKGSFPYDQNFLVDDFFLYKSQYSMSETSIKLPNGPQFEKISKLFKLLKTGNLLDAKQLFVSPENENVEKGLTFIARQELLSVVASWKEKGHYIVMVTNEKGMDKFLFPIVIQEAGDQKIETNALFLGSFIGAFGNCVGQGMISKIDVSAGLVDNFSLGGLSIPRFYIWLSMLLIVFSLSFVIWQKRVTVKNQRR